MKKISTARATQTRKFGGQKLTIGLDLGDRSSWYCVLDEAGEVLAGGPAFRAFCKGWGSFSHSVGALPPFRKERGKGGAPDSCCVDEMLCEFIMLEADSGSFDSAESLAARSILFRSGLQSKTGIGQL